MVHIPCKFHTGVIVDALSPCDRYCAISSNHPSEQTLFWAQTLQLPTLTTTLCLLAQRERISLLLKPVRKYIFPRFLDELFVAF